MAQGAGDAVEAGEVIAEVETDKSVLEISASAAAWGRTRCGRRIGRSRRHGDGGARGRRASRPSEPSAAAGTAALPRRSQPLVRRRPQPRVRAVRDVPPGRAPHRASPRQRRLAALAEQAGPGRGRIFAGRPAGQFLARPIARQVSRPSEIPHFAVARDIAADGVTDRLAGEMPRSPGESRICSSGRSGEVWPGTGHPTSAWP